MQTHIERSILPEAPERLPRMHAQGHTLCPYPHLALDELTATHREAEQI